MDLREFVRLSIEQVIQGVKDSHRVAVEHGCIVGDRYPTTKIEFDVAVTINESDESQKGAKLQVWGIGIGTEGKSESKNSTVSRIKFTVQVSLPYSDTIPA